jgi:hypothetical protein
MDHDISRRACSCDCRYLLLLVSFLEPSKPVEGATALLLLLLLEVPEKRVEEQNLLAKWKEEGAGHGATDGSDRTVA